MQVRCKSGPSGLLATVPFPQHNPSMRTALLTFLGVNVVIFLWPVFMLAAVRWGSADEQWLVRTWSPFVLPFTCLLWCLAIRAARRRA